MEDRTKIAAAAAAGYVAGRTKKGKAAIRLVMWLSGDQSGPRAVNAARTGALQLYQSEQAQQIAKQVSGPLQDAIQKAAVAMVMSRVQGISDNLASKTLALQGQVPDDVSGAAGELTDAVNETGEKTKKSLKDRLRPWGSKDSDNEESQPEESAADDGDDEDVEETPEDVGAEEADDTEGEDEAPGQDDEGDEEEDESQDEDESDLEEPESQPEPAPEAPKARKPRTAKKAASDA